MWLLGITVLYKIFTVNVYGWRNKKEEYNLNLNLFFINVEYDFIQLRPHCWETLLDNGLSPEPRT